MEAIGDNLGISFVNELWHVVWDVYGIHIYSVLRRVIHCIFDQIASFGQIRRATHGTFVGTEAKVQSCFKGTEELV